MTIHPTYTQLPLSANEIRLLTIAPAAARSDPIICTLHETRLSSSTPNSFETISYTWGDASLSGDILVNGEALRIPASAVAAIRNVRTLDRERVVWIDSVCINQNDLAERGEQVTLMSRVYQMEQANLIHLADLEEGVAERAFAGAQEICREVEAVCKERGERLEDIVFPGRGPWRYAMEGLRKKVDLRALGAMYNLPWFRRLWVVQEAVLAQTNMIVCGNLRIDFEKVLTATCWLEHKTFFLDHEEDEMVVGLFGFRGAMNMWLFRWDLAVYKHHPPPNPLSCLLGKAPFGASSDIKDQVYGMLGLYQASAKTMDLPPGLAPDYTKDDAEVLRDATRAAIEEKHSLDLLERLPQYRENRPRGLPTWVPEWFREYQTDDARALMPIFNAGGQSDEWSKTEPLPTNDARVLRIKGLVVSTVDKIANKTNDLHEVEAMLSHLDEVEAITSTLKIDPLTLGAVLLGGAGFDDTARATPAEVNVWPKYLKQIHAEKEHPPWLNHLESNADEQERALAMFNATFHNACRHRCFFSTMDGQIGIGPIRSRPGDSVVVLQGGLFPFVLRGKQDGQSELIGYCYVHGVMDGEAVEKLDRGAVEAAIFDLI